MKIIHILIEELFYRENKLPASDVLWIQWLKRIHTIVDELPDKIFDQINSIVYKCIPVSVFHLMDNLIYYLMFETVSMVIVLSTLVV